MAVLSALVRQRKSQLVQLRTLVRKTMAGFNLVNRELTRLVNRKKSLPEASDLEGVVAKMVAADRVFDQVTASVQQMASSWK